MHVLDYRMYLNGLGLSKKTINYHIVAIRSFFKFCLKNDIDCISPEKLELSKIPNREVNYLLEDEVQKIMEAPLLLEKDDLKRKRDLAILWTLYGTGLRVSELVSIKRSQINSDSKQFSVV
jgi:site-specific recombinase XerD